MREALFRSAADMRDVLGGVLPVAAVVAAAAGAIALLVIVPGLFAALAQFGLLLLAVPLLRLLTVGFVAGW
ncbi:MAG TPA: hypothetical protein VMU82_03095 [Acetobacteraceae bacterium]|nr:hypothetical protein [Acetobacteraceae bacterium]